MQGKDRDLKDRIQLWILSVICFVFVLIANWSVKDLVVVGEERIERLTAEQQGLIFALWHGKMLLPMYYLRQRGYYTLASLSKAGECISWVLNKLGWQIMRGSNLKGSKTKGSVRSLIRLIKVLRRGETVAITPDGPRGPRHQLSPGVLYLAQKSEAVVVPIGVAMAKKKEVGTWDRFNIPYPFTKGAIYFAPAIEVPTELSKAEREAKKEEVEEAILAADKKAEALLN
ncbi:lysophospholipid acyltransferase family protein [Fuchsiella alkaliacetigena]|uniref:lysophospholipid acyltransferase family protein n=1 Tax=Fuchsiella alkaliacetigena TaxID=957042 RepID=UPI00200A5337|nr:lysophospholipid acyltransferase family protein [Fuchsiella alkaliacetigena]MCK8824274.1 lysophospholipid acyltransferase family protein [Fuchsiella alkaliacetigena]